jgi:hypothetical protein
MISVFYVYIRKRYIRCLALNMLTKGSLIHSVFTYAYNKKSTQFLLTTCRQHYDLVTFRFFRFWAYCV